jgi:hypothetical protein
MIMPGEAPASARLLPRLARLLMSRNDMRRSTDRAESTVVIALSAAFLAAVIAASLLGAHVYQSQQSATARLRPAVAVLSQRGPRANSAGYGQARARWRAPDGRPRSGVLSTVTAPSLWGAAPGARVRVWVTISGEPSSPPPGQIVAIFDALGAVIWAAGGAGVALVLCYWVCRLMIDRRRLAAWESAWALTGPRWTSHR